MSICDNPSYLIKLLYVTIIQLEFGGLLSISESLLVHMSNKIAHTMRVAALVIVPRNQLHKLIT